MDASDVIQKNKDRAKWVNFQPIVTLQPGSAISCGFVSSGTAVVRYPSFETRNDIRVGRANCAPCNISSSVWYASTIGCFFKQYN